MTDVTESLPGAAPGPRRLTEEEIDHAATILFTRIENEGRAVAELVGIPHAPASPLVGDDRASDPHKVSGTALRALSTATDHLDALKTLIVDAGTLHLYAPFTLIRGAIETASAAVWVLAPTTRAERVKRSLQLGVRDAIDGNTVAEEACVPIPRPLADRREQVDNIARALGVATPVKAATSTEIVRGAQEVVDTSMNVLTAWRVCSGFAHGRTWATVSVLEREEFESHTPGDVLLKLTSSVDRVMWAAWAAADTIDKGVELYRSRSSSPWRQ